MGRRWQKNSEILHLAKPTAELLGLLLFSILILLTIFVLPSLFDGGDPTTPLHRARLRAASDHAAAARSHLADRLRGRAPPRRAPPAPRPD